MSAKAAATGLFVAAVVGWWIGNATDHVEVKHQVIHVHDTKTVTHEVPVETIVRPKACDQVLIYSLQVMKAADQLDRTTSAILEALSDTRKAAIDLDFHAANNIETHLRAVDEHTYGATQTLGEIKNPLQQAAAQCRNGDIQ